LEQLAQPRQLILAGVLRQHLVGEDGEGRREGRTQRTAQSGTRAVAGW
jgi:hypothetical protein